MRKLVLWVITAIAVFAVAGVYLAGSRLMAPAQKAVGDPPQWLDAKTIQIPSGSGSELHGWYYSPPDPHATVVLLHPVRGNRRSMLGRARFLSDAGMAVLLLDFQAHGESIGEQITFGHLESRDAIAAVDFAKTKRPGKPVFVLGSSLGGAAAILADPPLDVDGLVLEAVFPNIEKAVENRLRLRLGGFGAAFASILTTQIGPRLGIDQQDLAPIDKSKHVEVPVLIVSGENDLRTTKADTVLLYESFKAQKSIWLVPGASHQDLHAYATQEYEERILLFLRHAIANAI